MKIELLIGIIGVSLSSLTFFIGRQTKAKEDGVESGKTLADINYIKARINELLDESKIANKNLKQISEKIILIEAITKNINRRLDTEDEKINKLEAIIYKPI